MTPAAQPAIGLRTGQKPTALVVCISSLWGRGVPGQTPHDCPGVTAAALRCPGGASSDPAPTADNPAVPLTPRGPPRNNAATAAPGVSYHHASFPQDAPGCRITRRALPRVADTPPVPNLMDDPSFVFRPSQLFSRLSSRASRPTPYGSDSGNGIEIILTGNIRWET